MRLLALPPIAELPGDTLLARLHGRRSTLSENAPDPAAVLAWLHPRLDRRLRRLLTPYLEVLAMRRLVIALRHRLAGEAVPAGLLRQTWLEPELTPLIEGRGEAVDVLARLEKALAEEYPFTSGLTVLFLNQGPGAVENSLNGGMLALAVRRSADPVVRRLLQGLIDLRNLLAIMRHWRWQLRLAPALLAGGSIPPARCCGPGRAATAPLSVGLPGGWQARFSPTWSRGLPKICCWPV